jgi:hypothetical protein
MQVQSAFLASRKRSQRSTGSAGGAVRRRALLHSDQDVTDRLSIDRSLLPMADQHVAARGRKLWTIFLEAGQNGEIALIHQLAAETLHVAGACLLLLLRAAMSQGAMKNLCMCCLLRTSDNQ